MRESGRILITLTQGADPGDISDAIGEFLKKYDQETEAMASEIQDMEEDEKKSGSDICTDYKNGVKQW